MKHLPPKTSIEVDVDLPGEGYIPRSYVPDMRLKIDLYRRLARVANFSELEDFRAELADRFGAPPPLVVQLLEQTEVRIFAHRWGVRSIHLEDQYAVFRYTSERQIRKLASLNAGRLRVVDGQSAYLPLDIGLTQTDAILHEVKMLLQRE